MMIGVRDMRLAEKAEQVNAAAESIEARYRSLAQFADKMLELVTVVANRTRVETLKADAGKYLAVGKDMQKLRNQAVAVRGTAASVAELSAADQERLLQISAEVELSSPLGQHQRFGGSLRSFLGSEAAFRAIETPPTGTTIMVQF